MLNKLVSTIECLGCEGDGVLRGPLLSIGLRLFLLDTAPQPTVMIERKIVTSEAKVSLTESVVMGHSADEVCHLVNDCELGGSLCSNDEIGRAHV